MAWERRWRKVAGNIRVAMECRERALAVPALPVLSPAAMAADAVPPGLIPRPVSTLTRPAQLPIASSTFIGCKQAIASASGAIEMTGRTKIPLMISGPIGVGKTAFALRLADDLSAEFPDGQLYADLSASGPESPSPDGIMHGFLRAMGVPARLVPDDRIQRTGLYRSLFVIDEATCHLSSRI